MQVALYFDEAYIVRYLDWRPGARLPKESQGNHIYSVKRRTIRRPFATSTNRRSPFSPWSEPPPKTFRPLSSLKELFGSKRRRRSLEREFAQFARLCVRVASRPELIPESPRLHRLPPAFSGLGSLRCAPTSRCGTRSAIPAFEPSFPKTRSSVSAYRVLRVRRRARPTRFASSRYVSKGSAADLRAKLARPLANTSVKLAWYIIDFDPEMKSWFEAAFIKRGKEPSANVDSTGGELQLFVDNHPTQVSPSARHWHVRRRLAGRTRRPQDRHPRVRHGSPAPTRQVVGLGGVAMAYFKKFVVALKKMGIKINPGVVLLIILAVTLLVLLWRWWAAKRKAAQEDGGPDAAAPRAKAPAGPPPVPKDRFSRVWHNFIAELPSMVRRSIHQFQPMVVLGGLSAGKTALITRHTDWQRQARYLFGSQLDDPDLQVYLGSRVLVLEVPASILVGSGRGLREALLVFFRLLFRRRTPVVVVALNPLELQQMTPDETRALADAIRGKINLLSFVRRKPIEVRLALTHLDRIPGFSDLAEVVRLDAGSLELPISPDIDSDALEAEIVHQLGNLTQVRSTALLTLPRHGISAFCHFYGTLHSFSPPFRVSHRCCCPPARCLGNRT